MTRHLFFVLPAIFAPLASAQLPGTLHFEDVTAARVVPTVAEFDGPNMKAVEAGDFDADGDLDVAIAVAGGTYGARRNKLYRNDAGVLFEVSGTALIPEFAAVDVSRTAHFRDFDGDGWTDLVVINDSFEFSNPVLLFRSVHPGGVFSHFVEEGLARGLGRDWACGGIAEDVDGDGDQDVYTGNYGGLGQDRLYENDGAGFFTTLTSTHVPPETDFTIDVSAADVNGDQKLDLLISNDFESFFTYYNDLAGQGSGTGDYRYGAGGSAGKQSLGASGGHGALEPADFDLDGRVDVYWTNEESPAGDVVLHNQGNDALGKAIFVEVPVTGYVRRVASVKSEVADLNGDGRPDVLVMTADRPAVLRNTSIPGSVSFVDWSPATAFPIGASLAGAHGAAFDSDGGGRADLLLGASTGDHLFDSVAGRETVEGALAGGVLPALVDQPPLAILGTADAGTVDTYVAGALSQDAYLALVLRGDDDLSLEVLRDGAVFESSDRGGIGVEEALQVELGSGGAWSVRVRSLASAGTGGRYVLELLAREDATSGVVNDDCADALVVSTGTHAFSNVNATTDGPAHAVCDLFGDDQVRADVWFDFQAPCTGTWTVSTCSTADFDTKIALYEGRDCPVTGFRLLACEEDTNGCANFTTTLGAQVVGGEWYKVRIGGYLGAQGSGTFSSTCVNEPGVANYCGTTPSSAGAGARLSAAGSRVVAQNDLTLTAIGLPPDQPGYFLTSATQGFVPLFGGSQGNLCLGAPQVRFSQHVLDSGPAGQVSFQPDLANLPQGVVIQPGETWNFQLWYRDANPGPTSNTSDGLAIDFL